MKQVGQQNDSLVHGTHDTEKFDSLKLSSQAIGTMPQFDMILYTHTHILCTYVCEFTRAATKRILINPHIFICLYFDSLTST